MLHTTIFKFLITANLLLSINAFAVNSQGSMPSLELTKQPVSQIDSSQSSSEVKVVLPALTLSKKTGLRIYQGEAFTGEAVSYYASGSLATSQYFKQGKRAGVLRKWFPDGTLSFESNYLNGRLHGETKSWWKNGKLRTQNTYVEGKTEGVSYAWYISGEKFKQMNYVAGKEVGIQQAWRKTGELYSNYEYVNGRIFGLKRANMCYGLEDEKVSSSN